MTVQRCEHFALIGNPVPAGNGCSECMALGEKDWIALRVCLSCGHVGCCEDSRHAHALAHFQQTGHSIIRPMNEKERWTWCYHHNRYFAEMADASTVRTRRSFIEQLGRRIIGIFRGRSEGPH
jgi:uncharacterized UBP type Zn finger protein